MDEKSSSFLDGRASSQIGLISTRHTHATKREEAQHESQENFITPGLVDFLDGGPPPTTIKEGKKPGAAKQIITKLKSLGRSSTESNKRSTDGSNKESIDNETGLVGEVVGDNSMGEPQFTSFPSGVVRPLGGPKMKARPEIVIGNFKRHISDDPDDPISAITVARHRGEASRMLEGDRSDDIFDVDMGSPQALSFIEAVRSPPVGRCSSEFYFGKADELPNDRSGRAMIQRFHEVEDAIRVVCPDDASFEAWKSYMNSYSEGRFNLSNPPPHPPLKIGFKYLPSVSPPTEGLRLHMADKYDALWRHWNQEFANVLIQDTMKIFDTNRVSVSFFDEAREVFYAEGGYDQPRVHRHCSIAAHCLLSQDVLVVLDAQQDWRFAGNPLVTDSPNIRFFAGAPMMSPCGQVLGVFAIFSSRPRTSFKHSERRALAEISSEFISDLDSQAERLTYRTTPLLDRESVYEPPHSSSKRKSTVSVDEADSEMVPLALRCRKSKTQLCMAGAYVDTSQGPIEHTPPSSADESSCRPQEEALSSRANHLPPQAVSSRTFSSSDLTSLYPHPPNTPDDYLGPEDYSTEPQLDLTDDDFVKPKNGIFTERFQSAQFGTSPFSPSHTAQDKGKGKAVDLSNHSSTRSQLPMSRVDSRLSKARLRAQQTGFGTVSGAYNGEGSSAGFVADYGGTAAQYSSPQMPDQSSSNSSSPLIDLSSPSDEVETFWQRHQESVGQFVESPSTTARFAAQPASSQRPYEKKEVLEEAERACVAFAQAHGYDLLYVVEVSPSRSNMTEQELFASKGLKRIFRAGFGDCHGSEFGSDVWLAGLRSKMFHAYSCTRAAGEGGGFQSGNFIPLASEGGPRENRTSGIVMVALRYSGISQGVNLINAFESHELYEFGFVIENILMGTGQQHKNAASLAYPENKSGKVAAKTGSPTIYRHRRNYESYLKHSP